MSTETGVQYPQIDPSIRTVGHLAAKAHDVLEARGWCTGEFAKADGRVCLLGAINAAAYGSPEPTRSNEDFRTAAVQSVGAALVELDLIFVRSSHPEIADAMFGWNDRQADVDGGAQVISDGLTAVAAAYAETPILAAVES